MQRREPFFKTVVIISYFLFIYIVQATVCPHVSIFGVKPLIIPLAAVGAGMFEGRNTGAFMGLFLGILMDLSFNDPTIVFTIALTLVGLVSGLLVERIIIRSFPSYFIMSILALALCSAIEFLSPLVFYGQSISALLDTAWRQIAASAVFTIPMYYLSLLVARFSW